MKSNKQWKQISKKILAVVLMLCMVLQLPYAGFGVEAEDTTATESQSSEAVEQPVLTFTDFGFEEETTVSGNSIVKSIEGKTLDGVAIEGIYLFEASNTAQAVYMGGDGLGIRLEPTASGNMYVRRYFGDDSNGTVAHTVYASEVGALTGENVKIKVGFEFLNESEDGTTGDVKVTMLFRDTYEETFTIKNAPLSSFQRTVRVWSAPGYSITVKAIKKEFPVLTFTNFGYEEETKVSGNSVVKSIEGKTLDEVAIEGIYLFEASSVAQAVYMGGEKLGIRLEPTASGNMYVRYYTEAGDQGVKCTLYASEVGALTGEDVKIKVGFEFLNESEDGTTGDVKVTMLIRDTYEETFTITGADLSCFNQTIMVWSAPGYSITVKAIKKEFPVLTFTNFGFEEVTTVTGGTKIAKSIEGQSLDEVSIEGIYLFEASSVAQAVYIGGDGLGIRLEPTASGNMYVRRYFGDDSDGTVAHTLYASEVGALTGTDVKIKVEFEFLNESEDGTTGDVKVTMLIRDTYEETFTITNAPLSCFNQTIRVWSAGTYSLTIKAIVGAPEAMANENHVEITQADFDFNGTQGATKRTDVTGELGTIRSELARGLVGTKLNMDILFPTSSDAKFCYGASTAAEDGLTIYSDGNGNLVLKDNINDSSYTIEAEKAGTTLVGKRFNLQISHVPNGIGGVLLGIWINGQLYQDDYLELPNITSLGRCIATTGTENASVTIWMPLESQSPNAEFEQITISDFKILDNEKSSVEKMYSGTLLDKVFTTKLRLWGSESGSGHGNLIHYGGRQSGWFGFVFKAWGPDRMSLIYQYTGSAAKTIDSEITPDKAGTTFTGQDIVMSISLEEADFDKDGTLDDVKLGVFFNGQLYNNRYYYVALDDGTTISEIIKPYVGLHCSGAGNGNIRYYSVDDWRKAINLETTPVDYGIADGTYTEAKSGSLGGATMSGKLLSANVKFADGGKVVAGGTNATDGFQIVREGEKLYLSSVSGSLAQTELDWTRAVLNLDREMNLKLSLKAVESDAYLCVWINDAFIGSYYVEGMTVGSYVELSNLTIASEERSIPENYDYTEYTFGDCGDFGLGYKTHTEDSEGAITGMATNEVIIQDKLLIEDDATVTVSGYTFAMNEGMLTLSAGDAAIMTTEVGSKAFTFALVQKYVDADGDGKIDDICLSAFVNDENCQYYLLDKTIDSNICISANGGSVTVQNELPAWPVNIEDVTTGYTLATDKDSIGVNGQAAEAGANLTAVGDYHIVYNTSEGKVQQEVAIYKDGDVNVDNEIDVRDLVALKKAQQGMRELTNAGIHAADFNDDGNVDTDDALLRKGLVTSVDTVKTDNEQTVFGVISDMHYIDYFNGNREMNFKRALEQYRKNGAELIIMNGDVSDYGTEMSYANLLETIQEVFPDLDQAPKMISMADAHEYYYAWEWITSNTQKESDVQNRFLTSFANKLGQTGLHSYVEVDGYHFIGLSADSTNPSSSNNELGTGLSWFSDETVTALEEALAAAEKQAAEEGEPNRAIFVAVHQPPAESVADSHAKMTQLKDVLRAYPQVVLFTSHTHTSVKQEDNIHQEYDAETGKGYTVVNTASLYYIGSGGMSYVNRHEVVSDVMENAYEFGEGLLVRVNGDKVRIERHDYYNDEKIKEDWVVTTSADGSTLTDYTTARKDARKAPEFAEGTELHVLQTSDTSVKLIFDAASHDDFVQYYYVQVLDANGNKVSSLTGNYSNNFHLGLDSLPEVQEIVLEGLTAGSTYTFKVQAGETFGHLSEEVSTEYTLQSK